MGICQIRAVHFLYRFIDQILMDFKNFKKYIEIQRFCRFGLGDLGLGINQFLKFPEKGIQKWTKN